MMAFAEALDRELGAPAAPQIQIHRSTGAVSQFQQELFA
jgi:hypothetical protein